MNSRTRRSWWMDYKLALDERNERVRERRKKRRKKNKIDEAAPQIPVQAIATLVSLAENSIAQVDEAIATMDRDDPRAEQAIDAGAALAGGLRKAVNETQMFLAIYQKWWDIQHSRLIKPG